MLDAKAEAFLRHHGVRLEGKKVLAGVSGGPDSLALLHLLWKQREAWGIELAAVHFDHMFRGEESYQEARFVQSFCEERNIPFEMRREDVSAYMKESGKSSQTAARECRYRFFEEAMKLSGASYLALGHHGDDQMETILMRLTRGSTGEARSGIPFSRPFGGGEIIRPFLCLERGEIEEYCLSNELDPRRDPSNEKDVYSRNRFRRNVLPFLKSENPQAHVHFQRFSEELRGDEQLLQELTAREMNTVMKKKEDAEITIDAERFMLMPMPLQRRGIQLILNYLYQERPASLSALHIEKIFSILSNPHPSGSLDFPNGLKIVRSYGLCHFRYSQSEVQAYRFEINQPGKIQLPSAGAILAGESGQNRGAADLNCFEVSRDNVHFPLIVRTRETGDRMTIKGMNGTKKVKSIFIDRKIPLHERSSWPIVTDSSGEILWIPGLSKSAYELPAGPGTRNIFLTYIKH
ncbi:tRNA lysidine(34) synthetase TilS [Bacillus infantis]|uniref:tRNA(Ile)-lysidine synthase n=1 Tax=Bacillus infantis TaxID=324767 RepID=A0A5D4QVI3_9BACI|nr:tRNA lysidine(34) synthetase TilS [Bacillus infantis]TYS41282.1 tRNA lysidine(34) synthetase TilS [Bacillus infantis]